MAEVFSSVAGLMSLIEHVEHPFGKGLLTTDGAQYGAETTIATTAFTEVPASMTVYRPPNTTIREIEFGLTGGFYNSTTAGTLRYKWQASDDNASWEDLHTAITSAVSVTTDLTVAGRFAPTGNFAGTANPFYLRMVAARSTGAVNVLAKAKNSSYVKMVVSPW